MPNRLIEGRPTGRPSRSPEPVRPKLAEGIELLGEYEGSGFKEPHSMVRRADGQVVQLPQVLYLIAEAADGSKDLDAIAAEVSERYGRGLDGESVGFLIDKKLKPLGVIAAAEGADQPQLKKIDPMLALKFRTAVIPARLVNAVTKIFWPLFLPPVIAAVLVGLVGLDAWLFFNHGIAQSARQILYQPALLLMILGLVVLSAAFHECGHATACRYGGAKPGVMGVGIYIVYPAFYTDVTDAYRLGRGGRLRTDLGGIYFNAIFSLLTAGAYFLTGFEPLLLVILLQQIEALHQLLPFLRLDGYYIVSDLTGVPDMYARIKPTLLSLIPGRKPDKSVSELKPWVRIATTAYVMFLVPALLFFFAMMLINAPRIFSTAWDSLFSQWDRVSAAFGGGKLLSGVAGVVQMAALVLPAAGMTMTTGRLCSRAGSGAWKRCEDRPAMRAGLLAGTLAAVGLVAFLWWPNGDYKPIQPGERGTIQGGVQALARVPTGKPSVASQPRSRADAAAHRAAATPKPAGAQTGQSQPPPSSSPSTTTPQSSPPPSSPPPSTTPTTTPAPSPSPTPTP
ncbi:MAG: putative peptide zinc metalloprotease protein [Solirubrobacterales bacterium]|nr:putative peptide zinc metalloprotease protein [Solirubrobacterales bacterium]